MNDPDDLTTAPRPAAATTRLGIWFVGARGSVATTSTVGALALRAGLVPPTGMVSTHPEVAAARLVDLADVVFGGHDVAGGELPKRAEELAAQGVLPAAVLPAVRDELEAVEHRVRRGLDATAPDQQSEIDRVAADLRAFREEHALDRVVVVDVSSTEPPVEVLAGGPLDDLDVLERGLAAGGSPLPASGAYALAAYRAGCPLVAFTPSPGPRLPAVVAAAQRAGLPWAGSDGKTGETLLKSVLGPMFGQRALAVRSWASYNMLGGGDGRTLSDPHAAASKEESKARGLEQILGHPVQAPLHIDYVPDLGDWKTAMDHIGFEGFLGARMTLQFTWTGCDSALAAPLVLDLARLVARAAEVGRTGPLADLGFFFKDPAGTEEHGLARQFDRLAALCAELGQGR